MNKTEILNIVNKPSNHIQIVKIDGKDSIVYSSKFVELLELIPTMLTKDEVMAMLTDILERIKAGDIKEEKADNDWGEGFIEAWGSANLNAQMVVEEKINSLKENKDGRS